jgi:hypothetical protein
MGKALSFGGYLQGYEARAGYFQKGAGLLFAFETVCPVLHLMSGITEL